MASKTFILFAVLAISRVYGDMISGDETATPDFITESFAYRPHVIEHSSDGDKRFIFIDQPSTSIMNYPCNSSCHNGGKCIADVSPGSQTEHCVCTHGYIGDTCSIAANVPRAYLPGVTGAPALTPITPTFDGFSSIPKDISCEINISCAITVVFYGSSNKPPKVGFVDNGLSAAKPDVLPQLPTQNTNIVITHVTATTTGSHQICLQTTVDGSETGVNIDEICINVNVSNADSSQPKVPKTPRFNDNTMMPAGSTMTCDTNIVCHIPIITEPTGNICPSVQQCAAGIPFAHVFPTVLKNGKCITDVAMKTETVDLKQQLCVSAGTGGEKRHFTIQTIDYSGTNFGPCQKLHCQNGGLCDHLYNTKCLCKPGFSGDTCDKACPAPPAGTHSTYVTINGTYAGSTARYQCNTGFEIAFTLLLTTACFNGAWTSAPVCHIKNCHQPSGNHATCTTPHGTLYGSHATCTCDQGYMSARPITIHCQDTGAWDPSPTCSIIDCLTPSLLAYLTCSTTSDTTYGSTATCTCDPGYQSSDNMSIECRETGAWDTAPTCTGWSPWFYTQCSVTCGNGTTSRLRHCSSGCDGDCTGAPFENVVCNDGPCSVDGQWSEWQAWSKCSVTCAAGKKSRARTCSNPPAAHGGHDCVGTTSDSKTCDNGPCPAWSQWFYSQCSATCGNGTTSRLRHCSSGCDGDCTGVPFENVVCNDGPCPVDGGWGDWASWSTCSHTCANGSHERTRQCDQPSPRYGGVTCNGIKHETGVCNSTACPYWFDYHEKRQCSVTCGDGVIQLVRECSTGNRNNCTGSPYDEKPCSMGTCP